MASSRALEFLESQPGTTFLKLYQQSSTALAIFRRMLPSLGMCFPSHIFFRYSFNRILAKFFVMALLYLKDPLPAADLELWVKQGSKR
jgi:transcription initiation factor TFIIH subunit 4